jgi:hypothetical protein
MQLSAIASLRARALELRGSPGFWGALVWFVVVLASIAWVAGLDPEVTHTPDEGVTRQAAGLVAAHGSPFIALPIADPEDLAHPRSWVSVGAHAIPSYAPLSIYWYGLLLVLGKLGLLAIIAFPASGVAAFVAGIARLLPAERRWLALAAPLMASPAYYWLVRPWMNISVLLTCLCWAVFCWATWRVSRAPRYLAWAVGFVGAAAAVRPDYAAYLFLVVLLLGLAEGAEHRKRLMVLVLVSGCAAVAVNLVLNTLGTGHPLLAAYQIEVARSEGDELSAGHAGPGALGLLIQLLAPMGVPTLMNALHYLGKYWLQMAGSAGLLLTQLALAPLLMKRARAARVFTSLALLVMLCFMLSRMDPGIHGAADQAALVDHSMPRYWSPIYLLATLPPLVFLGYCRWRWLLATGTVAVFALALVGGYDVYWGTKWSLAALHHYRERWSAISRSLAKVIPERAFVYSESHDKMLWRHFRVGTLGAPRPTATSMARAIAAGMDVFVYEPYLTGRGRVALERALAKHSLAFRKLRRPGLLRVERAKLSWQPPASPDGG